MNRIAKLLWMIGLAAFLHLDAAANDLGKTVNWDRYSLIIDGHRVCPVMGEVHYSRIPADEWQREVRRMREGGVTMLATYVSGITWKRKKACSDGTASAILEPSLKSAKMKVCLWCCALVLSVMER